MTRRHGAALLRRERNGGPAAARNAGVQAATTELIAFVDSDTVPDGDWISALAAPSAGSARRRRRPADRRPCGLTGPGGTRRPAAASISVREPASVRALWPGRPRPDSGARSSGAAPWPSSTTETVRSTRRCGWGRTSTWSGDCSRPAGGSATSRGSSGRPRRADRLDRSARRADSATARRPRRSGCATRTASRPWCSTPGTPPPSRPLLAGRPVTAAARSPAPVLATRRAVHARRPSAQRRRAGHACGVCGQTWLGAGRYATQFAAPLLLAAALTGPAAPPRSRPPRSCSASAAEPLAHPAASSTRPRSSPAPLADDIAYGAGVLDRFVRRRPHRCARVRPLDRPLSTPIRRRSPCRSLVRDRRRSPAAREEATAQVGLRRPARRLREAA